MVTSGIVDVSTPHAERVLRAMKSSGISRYRWVSQVLGEASHSSTARGPQTAGINTRGAQRQIWCLRHVSHAFRP
jgi:hypothetical protein